MGVEGGSSAVAPTAPRRVRRVAGSGSSWPGCGLIDDNLRSTSELYAAPWRVGSSDSTEGASEA